jgi:glyoxylase-like metal-dependent hydrolase (beta-lactamase superfamily II)
MKTWRTTRGTVITRLLAGRSNVFLVSREGRNVLVDTSPAYRWLTLKRRLRRLGIASLDALVLTHAHFDHAGSAARLQKEFAAPVIVQRAEAEALASGASILPEGTSRFTRFLVARLRRLAAGRARCAPCRADVLVGERLDLRAYGVNAYVLHTPGHTPGSQSVIVDDEIALVGDAMFGVFPASAFPPFATDAARLVASWGKLLETGCRLFLPSHGSANSRRLLEKDCKKRMSANENRREHAGR